MKPVHVAVMLMIIAFTLAGMYVTGAYLEDVGGHAQLARTLRAIPEWSVWVVGGTLFACILLN